MDWQTYRQHVVKRPERIDVELDTDYKMEVNSLLVACHMENSHTHNR